MPCIAFVQDTNLTFLFHLVAFLVFSELIQGVVHASERNSDLVFQRNFAPHTLEVTLDEVDKLLFIHGAFSLFILCG